MISVKVTYENMVDTTVAHLMAHHLNLCGFTTIDEKQILVVIYKLCCMVSSKSKGC